MTTPIPLPTPDPAPSPTPDAPPLLPSQVRTVVPFLVGWVASLAATGQVEHALGVSDATARTAITGGVTVIVGAAYYGAVRWLETRKGSSWGWLLGLAKAPAYKA